jgi:hypothetical protein
MLVSMKNSALVDKLVTVANGNYDLVVEAIRACNGDLKDVVEYIVRHRERGHVVAEKICS